MQASPAGQRIEAFRPRHPKLAELMLRAEDDVLAYKT
jgi:putative transposase